MCIARKQPQASTPAAATPPPADPITAPVVDAAAQSEKNLLASRKRGAGALRIDLASSALSGGSGLSIPTS